MVTPTRRARVKAFAKVNLCLEVLGRRPDGYHDLRTIFQTISLADTLEIEFTPGRRTEISLDSDLDIPDNLVVRAAKAVLEASRATGVVRLGLAKRIPMGGGLGGGSSDAAAVLLALPALTGRTIDWERQMAIGASLGSDVPFFLVGGTALGLGRGTDLYPIAEAEAKHALLVTSGIHVSTPEAFRALARPLTWDDPSPKINISHRVAFNLSEGTGVALAGTKNRVGRSWAEFCDNDFESVVFRQHPELGAIKQKLRRLGARPALMTGSGSAVFGVFSTASGLKRAQAAFPGKQATPISFLNRARYYAAWWEQLSEHMQGKEWPPHSRYSR